MLGNLRKHAAFIALCVVVLAGSMSLSGLILRNDVQAQKKMPAISTSVIIDLDGTVRNLGSGTTSISATPQEGLQIIVSLDSSVGTEYALVQMTASDGTKPATITTSTAQWYITGGQEIVFNTPSGQSENAKWDLRQLFAVGSGKLRVKVVNLATNTTPS